ncbi:hypothetical protein ACOSP7_022234 [Xanthoceras sorbifolium]|uniref:Autophagy-related protein 13 N-terminal domain-containing protein n=1 Tax=Xanthoceras sorbifolium TaxID=99658 RepID=A0ABQ8HNU1_9ROSI|nr:hypothetical protein JRO89_XS08G0062700 [Xanthoceras sorbifolium]
MASSHSNIHSEAAKMEQIITEFYTKSLHIILESRSPYMSSRNFSGEQILSSPSSSSSSSSSVRPRDKWFNLALRECPAALENLDFWRQSNLEPMVIDVILVQRPVNWDTVNFSPQRDIVKNLSSKERYPFCWGSDQEEIGCEGKSEKIVERWVVQYESRKVRDCSSGSRRSSNNTLSNVYKKSILLLRSLYATVRLLPAYKIFRDLNSSGQICMFSLAHRVSSFVEPFTRKEEAEFQRFGFTPVDTSCGRLCISVLYRSSLSDVNSEPSTPMSPQVIPDYVGSPLADPLKRLPSLPISHGSPSSLPFSRRHSWSYDHLKASPPSVSFSPSPTHSEPHVSISNLSSRHYPPMSLPPHPPETSLIHKKNTSFDEYCPSPNFTPSASPSPPIYIPGGHLKQGLLRSESAPFSTPAAKLLSSRQNLSPSSPIKITRSGTSKIEKNMGPIHSGTTMEKLLSLGKDDSRRYSGVKLSSNNSPQVSFSRSSSRSFQDDFDDEFPCPFDVEDVDMTDRGSRPESFDQKGLLSEPLEPGGFFPIKKSQDAAVGALVCMLKKAPPLRQDLSSTTNLSEASRPESWSNSVQETSRISKAPSGQNAPSPSVASSGLLPLKTTADALEELRSYKEMKNLLLSQGARSHASADYPSPAETSSRDSNG